VSAAHHLRIRVSVLIGSVLSCVDVYSVGVWPTFMPARHVIAT
jgi:hypothetical protein